MCVYKYRLIPISSDVGVSTVNPFGAVTASHGEIERPMMFLNTSRPHIVWSLLATSGSPCHGVSLPLLATHSSQPVSHVQIKSASLRTNPTSVSSWCRHCRPRCRASALPPLIHHRKGAPSSTENTSATVSGSHAFVGGCPAVMTETVGPAQVTHAPRSMHPLNMGVAVVIVAGVLGLAIGELLSRRASRRSKR